MSLDGEWKTPVFLCLASLHVSHMSNGWLSPRNSRVHVGFALQPSFSSLNKGMAENMGRGMVTTQPPLRASSVLTTWMLGWCRWWVYVGGVNTLSWVQLRASSRRRGRCLQTFSITAFSTQPRGCTVYGRYGLPRWLYRHALPLPCSFLTRAYLALHLITSDSIQPQVTGRLCTEGSIG